MHKGEIVGIAGLMGAGRTELAMSIFGRSYGLHIRGTLIKDGVELQLKNVRQAIDHKIAYTTHLITIRLTNLSSCRRRSF